MTDDAKHGAGEHIPTPAEVHRDHPTVLVPVPEDGDAVRRIETHDDAADADGIPSAQSPTVVSSAAATEVPSAPATSAPTTSAPFAAGSPWSESPFVDPAFTDDDEASTEDLAQVVARAAAAVPGVHGLGSAAARAVDSARTRLLGRTGVPGVNILVEADALSVDVSLVAEYPANVSEVADSVRTQVAAALGTRHEGVVDIDVTVTDVHGPFDPADPDPGQAIDDAKVTAGAAKIAAADAVDDLADAVDADTDARRTTDRSPSDEQL